MGCSATRQTVVGVCLVAERLAVRWRSAEDAHPAARLTGGATGTPGYGKTGGGKKLWVKKRSNQITNKKTELNKLLSSNTRFHRPLLYVADHILYSCTCQTHLSWLLPEELGSSGSYTAIYCCRHFSLGADFGSTLMSLVVLMSKTVMNKLVYNDSQGRQVSNQKTSYRAILIRLSYSVLYFGKMLVNQNWEHAKLNLVLL